jgi:hypothetical protein
MNVRLKLHNNIEKSKQVNKSKEYHTKIWSLIKNKIKIKLRGNLLYKPSRIK